MELVKFDKKTKRYCVVNWDWSESCRNVYKRFEVFINGKKSNLTGLKNWVDTESIPDIVSANTYFWSPGGSASNRRSNERRRTQEGIDWLETNGFRRYINIENEIKGRRRGEKFGIDVDGFVFEKSGEKYHWDNLKNVDLQAARDAITKRIAEKKASKANALRIKKRNHQIDEYIKQHPGLLVNVDDSISAGNCPYGTDRFRIGLIKAYNKINPYISASASVFQSNLILSHRDDDYTRRAIRVAAIRSMRSPS
jgi:hypothetical protein